MITAQDTTAVVRKIYEAYNQRNLDQGARLFADGGKILNVPLGATFTGPNGFKESANGWLTAFPDSRVEVTNLIATEEWVACEFIGRGTHSGPLNGPLGLVPATGKRIELRFAEIFRVRDGKIEEQRIYFDSATLMRQLGLLD